MPKCRRKTISEILKASQVLGYACFMRSKSESGIRDISSAIKHLGSLLRGTYFHLFLIFLTFNVFWTAFYAYLHTLLIEIFIMSKGTVKFFNETKGFGFITEEGSGTDHFVHISGLVSQIREGDSVEFELENGKKGLNAVQVTVI